LPRAKERDMIEKIAAGMAAGLYGVVIFVLLLMILP
jgi:hypothetical protein